MQVQVFPSLLAADFGHLAEGARRAEEAGGDALHIDVMDGVFVPNISMGPAVVAMARREVHIPLSVHLMIVRPDRYVDVFADAGATSLLIHIESEGDISATLKRIRARGLRCGITVNPETPAERLFPVLDAIDEVLCMTVHPGYGGQAFIPETLPKIEAVRRRANDLGHFRLDILVDGGINIETAAQCAARGANCFVAGTFLYQAADMSAMIVALREAAKSALKLFR